jgi:hypothetical protein
MPLTELLGLKENEVSAGDVSILILGGVADVEVPSIALPAALVVLTVKADDSRRVLGFITFENVATSGFPAAVY